MRTRKSLSCMTYRKRSFNSREKDGRNGRFFILRSQLFTPGLTRGTFREYLALITLTNLLYLPKMEILQMTALSQKHRLFLLNRKREYNKQNLSHQRLKTCMLLLMTQMQ